MLGLCQAVADSDIRNVRKCECQIFDRQNLSCEILRNHEKVHRIMHLVAKLSDFWLFHPGFFSLFYNRFYLSSHLCEADSLSTSEALIGILAILNVYGSVTKRLRSSSASCECSPQCLPQKAYLFCIGKNLFANLGPLDCNSGHAASQRNRAPLYS